MENNRSRLLALVIVIAVIIAAAWFWRTRQGGIESGAIDLVDLFPDAEKRTTMASLEEGYAIQTVTIDGDRKRAIFAHPFSRILWTVTVPEHAVLRASAGLRPDAWSTEGDGALFRVGVSDGPNYTEYFKQMIQPFDKPGDRRWFPVEVDLTPYAGKQIKIVFNTEPGPSGNAVGDASVWGMPRIVPDSAGTN
jgi:hypothetical protein